MIKIADKEYELDKITLGDLYRAEKLLKVPFGRIFQNLESIETVSTLLFCILKRKYPDSFETLDQLLDQIDMTAVNTIFTAIGELFQLPAVENESESEEGKLTGAGKKQK